MLALKALSWLALVAPLQAHDAAALPEGNAYVRSVLNEGPRSQDAAINEFTYDLEETKERLDKNGIVTSRETLGYQVYFVQTRPVRRLVSKNGIPLGAKDQADIDRRAEALAKAIAEGRTVSERAGIRLSGLVGSFNFKTVGREERESRETLIFDFEPREHPEPGASLGGATDAMARILLGRVQIDESDRRVVRLDVWNQEGRDASVSTGVKVKTFHLSMDFAPVEKGVWLPRFVIRRVEGRAFFFRTFRIRQTTVYSNYQRFKVETEEERVPVQ